MKFSKLFPGISVCLSLISASRANEQSNANVSENTVVLISVDGLAAYYFDDSKAEMPNIHALAAAGAKASSMKAVAPTVTWPNHTTLVTGATPARHGVVGNNLYDRAQKKQITLIFDPTLDKDQIVKIPTIYDIAKSNGLRTAGINWPASRNAHTLDWTTPEVHVVDLYRQYATPALLSECQENGIAILDGIFPDGKRTTEDRSDAVNVRTFNFLLQKHRPNLAILHLGNVDHVEHDHGPKSAEAYAAIKNADNQVGNIWKELQQEFPGKATLIVVSDHGFSPIEKIVLPNIILRQAGLVEVADKKITGGSVRVVVQGGAAMLYVLDTSKRDAVIAKIKSAFQKIKGVSKVVGPDHLNEYGVANPKDDPNAPDVILFAAEGCSFGDTAAGDLPFNEKPERLGSHGHDPNLPNLHATFVAWGAGIKAGARLGEIKNIDVAPTIARLLKLSFPTADGKPLDSILEK